MKKENNREYQYSKQGNKEQQPFLVEPGDWVAHKTQLGSAKVKSKTPVQCLLGNRGREDGVTYPGHMVRCQEKVTWLGLQNFTVWLQLLHHPQQRLCCWKMSDCHSLVVSSPDTKALLLKLVRFPFSCVVLICRQW